MGKKKSALFLGGTRGIGLQLALEAKRRDVSPIVIGREISPEVSKAFSGDLCAEFDLSNDNKLYGLIRALARLPDTVFWIAGAYASGPLVAMSNDDIPRILMMHQLQMVKFIKLFHYLHLQDRRREGRPYTLVVMGSVSSYKLRKHEAVYAMAKAGQAEFLRQFAMELVEDSPGSRILLVNCGRIGNQPGEQKTDEGGKQIDPAEAAWVVWDKITKTTKLFTEINIERSVDWPNIIRGPQTPESL